MQAFQFLCIITATLVNAVLSAPPPIRRLGQYYGEERTFDLSNPAKLGGSNWVDLTCGKYFLPLSETFQYAQLTQWEDTPIGAAWVAREDKVHAEQYHGLSQIKYVIKIGYTGKPDLAAVYLIGPGHNYGTAVKCNGVIE